MNRLPENQGLYDRRFEHDACGVGAVINIDGNAEHKVVEQAKTLLVNLHHRGAAGADEVTGDGAGILMQMPYSFFAAELAKLGMDVPAKEHFAAAMVFLPKQEQLRDKCLELISSTITAGGVELVGRRDVPVSRGCLGEIALSAEPHIAQIFMSLNQDDAAARERKLYIIRRRCEKLIAEKLPEAKEDFYICSMSSNTICYKGMFMADQLFSYYPDLADEEMKTAIAIVHQRYSTNTFPSWPLAHPFRCIAHNGEINTLSGNRNHMMSRENRMSCELFGDEISDIVPVLDPEASDSACFDMCLEMLCKAGRSMPHAMMMMVPEAFGPSYHISIDKRAFYEYHASILEPWDGPAAILFTDGTIFGGTLDRNGLRPCRYVVTDENTVIIGSEVGVIDLPPEKIRRKGRLQPGKMFLVDTSEKRIITDNEIKAKIARRRSYRRWLNDNRIELRGLFDSSKSVTVPPEIIYKHLRCFGYTAEELRMILAPMAANGQEPVGSMGNDAALAVLSDQPKSIFNYFKQMFAQVTNPPIDPLREGLVMSLMSYVGKKRNLLSETPEHCRQLRIPHPVLTNEDMKRLRDAHRDDFRVVTLPALFDPRGERPQKSLQAALDELVESASREIRENNVSIIIVSDRGVSEDKAPIPALLACSALNKGLLKNRLRGEAGIIIESGEPREVNHFCLLCGYGADAVNPYLALETLTELQNKSIVDSGIDPDKMIDNYIAAVKKGILKTISKMGISTLRSYRSAQLFEAVGLNRELVDKYFAGTVSRIQGIGLAELAAEAVKRHSDGFKVRREMEPQLDFGGEYYYRDKGQKHMWTPTAIANMQKAVRQNDKAAFREFCDEMNDYHRTLCTLRSMFEFKPGKKIDISEVEPAEDIIKRFCTGAMSHGSISKEAHECMAIAMNRIGAMSNTGEGGEDVERYQPEKNGDSKNCAIKQVASGRFGVTINYLAHAKEIQIKMAQGAKPGEGGHLPGHKVTDEIAKLRYSTPGVSLISPPPHHDIYSIEDLAQLIYDLKCSNPGVKVSVKLVSEVGVGTIAAGVAKGNADEVLISGGDGGSGATPLSSIKHAGIPWELGLAETQQVLIMNGLRERIRVQTDGQLRTGRDVVIAAMLGADQYGFGTSALVALGCVLMRKCHLGTCPAGIATQNKELRCCFAGKPEHLVNYMMLVAQDIRKILAELGFSKLEDIIGRVDLLETTKAIQHWKARGLDFSAILRRPEIKEGRLPRLAGKQADKLKDHIDWLLIDKAKAALEKAEPVIIEEKIRNQNRTAGAILSNRVVKKYGLDGLPDNTIDITFHGSAGQSFGAFLAKGITLRLIGDSNDYLGKGLSGGRIIVKIPQGSRFRANENIIVGNTLLYGATGGEVFINGVAGERFAVRNSGAAAVVEGVGDHGCEYMTNGVVVVLGSTGRNFAAGMSGGVAYVFDELQLFDTLCNLDMVDLESVWHDEDKTLLKNMITRHYEETGSQQARYILDSWRDMVGRFVKIMPVDYRKALERLKNRDQRSNDNSPATEEVYNNG
ncbi:Ferredoxin-dependent glutamate synthase 1 [Limihaloglobus sulfuriphilus]|uniref:Glutamate synthase [NADPH] large chain n=1 Tax=Limihaloglobus sulfuriphilus TaxID=1851148 RepID=A0A1R7T640_9BACT|nr:glutamate synthase large subunit [Limihaloglobus sulfuriphilus]AQQ72266.1 Ferredoxin-dependent glutamate synthase 1 [Limihaloglobus sulfuriphilus]